MSSPVPRDEVGDQAVRPPGQDVVSVAAEDPVLAGAAGERVVAGAAQEYVEVRHGVVRRKVSDVLVRVHRAEAVGQAIDRRDAPPVGAVAVGRDAEPIGLAGDKARQAEHATDRRARRAADGLGRAGVELEDHPVQRRQAGDAQAVAAPAGCNVQDELVPIDVRRGDSRVDGQVLEEDTARDPAEARRPGCGIVAPLEPRVGCAFEPLGRIALLALIVIVSLPAPPPSIQTVL